MFKKRHDELHRFLEWRRQTRFLRHYGGPILAFALFVMCLGFVWRACQSRPLSPWKHTESMEQQRVIDHLLQASKSPIK